MPEIRNLKARTACSFGSRADGAARNSSVGRRALRLLDVEQRSGAPHHPPSKQEPWDLPSDLDTRAAAQPSEAPVTPVLSVTGESSDLVCRQHTPLEQVLMGL